MSLELRKSTHETQLMMFSGNFVIECQNISVRFAKREISFMAKNSIFHR